MTATLTPAPRTAHAGHLAQLAYEACLPFSLSSPADRQALVDLAAAAYRATLAPAAVTALDAETARMSLAGHPRHP